MTRGRFTTEADVRLVTDAPVVALLAPLRWEDADGTVHVVPTGFRSDGASVPRLAWWLLGHPLERRIRRAAILHDHQCATRREPSAVVHARFRAALLADGTRPWRAWCAWAGVRVAGPRWERARPAA